jgi:hypothetical protein
MSIINDALQKAGDVKKTVVENIAKDIKKSVMRLPVADKKASRYKWVLAAGAAIIFSAVVLTLLSKRGAVKEGYTPTKIVYDAGLSAADVTPFESIINNRLPEPESGSMPDRFEFRLMGIVLGEGGAMAIINDSVYMTGDTVNGLRIIKITKDTVLLEKNGGILELHVQ